MENTQPTNQIQPLEVMPPPSPEYIRAAEQRSLNFLNPKLWTAMQTVAQTLMQSGALPSTIKNVQQLVMVLQAGFEAGLQPLESVKSFYFVNGGIALYGEMAITLVLRAGHKVEWGVCNAETATVTITRKDNGMSMTNTFTMAEAKERMLDMGSHGRKDPWVKFPENMLKFKAFHMTAKFICPDALHGMDVGEVIDNGEQSEEKKNATVIKAEEPAKPRRSKKADKAEEAQTEVAEAPAAEDIKAGEPVAVNDAVEVEKVAEETEEQKYARLVDEELEGRTLTPKEVMFINAYRARTQGA